MFWFETNLEEFAKVVNINAFIRSLQYVMKAKGRGAISTLARTLKILNGLGCKIQLESA